MNVQNFYTFDAAGYTAADIKGMFVDAQARGDMNGGKIIEYRWDENGLQLYAIVRNRKTVSVYEMNLKTGKASPVDQPPNGPVLRRARRPRLSRDMKIWRATKAWEER
jgi:hypothetical protein